MFLNCASESALIFWTLSESVDLNFSFFNWPRLIRTFSAAPSMPARVASAPTPTSEIEAGFPFSAISTSNAYDFHDFYRHFRRVFRCRFNRSRTRLLLFWQLFWQPKGVHHLIERRGIFVQQR